MTTRSKGSPDAALLLTALTIDERLRLKPREVATDVLMTVIVDGGGASAGEWLTDPDSGNLEIS
jgi:hypothetical protein